MKDKIILMIEDETDVLLSNQEYFEGKGARVLAAESLAEADELLAQNTPDVILLDVKLPDGSGLDYVRKIREKRAVPVVFLTCHNEKEEIIRGLTGGGCDYVAKPHDLDVLCARLQGHLRRAQGEAEMPSHITAGNITMSIDTHRAFVAGQDALLKPMEYALLLYFVKNKNKVLSAQTLYGAVWGRSTNSDLRTLRVHIHEIRSKLNMGRGEIEGEAYIETISGGGYCFWCT